MPTDDPLVSATALLIEEQQAKIRHLLLILCAVEWSGCTWGYDPEDACPCCGARAGEVDAHGNPCGPHEPDCELAAAIGKP